MDERELANHVLEVADRTAYQNAAQRVTSIHLSIGGRRLIDLERLTRAFDTVARGTVAEGAVLRVSVLPVSVLPVRHHCQNCGIDFDGATNNAPCPNCGHPHTEFIGGEEIRVVEIQVDDDAA
jgi:hydrogenase nickel incorporation protein HypA/HybF